MSQWKYTEKGWFIFEYCTAQPPELTEVVDAYEMNEKHDFLSLESSRRKNVGNYMLYFFYCRRKEYLTK